MRSYEIGTKLKTEILLNKEIYEREYLDAAVRAYEDGVALIDLLENNLYWICQFRDCCYGPEIIVSEFENYLIDLQNCLE